MSKQKRNAGLDWLIFLVSTVACIAFIIWWPAWFWVTLPFICTFFVRALGWM